jgi:hypothetical protein
MASTRNKLTKMNVMIDIAQTQRQTDWIMSESIKYNPAFPCGGINVQYVPSNLLDSRAVDIESSLFGIQNYIFPTVEPKPKRIHLPNVEFTPARPVFIPILPAHDRFQRPTL